MNMLITSAAGIPIVSLPATATAKSYGGLSDLKALYVEVQKKWEESERAKDVFNTAERKLKDALPPVPQPNPITMPPEVQEYVETLTVREFQKLPADSPYRKWNEEQQMAYNEARAVYEAAKAKAKAEIGFDEISAAWESACTSLFDSALAVIDHPATGLEAMRIKAATIRLVHMDETHEAEVLEGLLKSIGEAA